MDKKACSAYTIMFLFALTCMDALMSQAHGAQERPSVGNNSFSFFNGKI